MASLKSLLGTKQDAFVPVEESNPEKGRIYVYNSKVLTNEIMVWILFHPRSGRNSNS